MDTVDVSKWPVREFERGFYRQIDTGGYLYLVPAKKLGRGQIGAAEKARREAALAILKDPIALETVRKQQADELNRSIEAAKILLGAATNADDRDSYTSVLVSLNATRLLPDNGPATDEDANYYANKHRADDEMFSAWIGALYIPFPNSPSVADIYKYLPMYVLSETQDFFVESLNAPDEKPNETLNLLAEDSGATKTKA